MNLHHKGLPAVRLMNGVGPSNSVREPHGGSQFRGRGSHWTYFDPLLDIRRIIVMPMVGAERAQNALD